MSRKTQTVRRKTKTKMRDSRFAGPDQVYDFADSVQAEDVRDDGPQKLRRPETWVEVQLMGERYGLPVSAIREIARVGDITRVPDAPPAVRGIINLRGRVVPVVDLRLRLGLSEGDRSHRSRVLIAEARGRVLGLLVDAVEQVVTLDAAAIEPVPDDVLSAGHSEYLVGIYQRENGLIVLVDAERIFVIPDANTTSTVQSEEKS